MCKFKHLFYRNRMSNIKSFFNPFGRLLLTSILLQCSMTLEDKTFHVYTTASCPRNKTEWEKRSSALNCTENNGYMCFPNDKLTKLQEFCYNVRRLGIIKGVCLFLYNNSRINSYECSEFIDGCPDSFYFSDTVYNYPYCLAIENGCFIAERLCIRKKSYTSSTSTQPLTTRQDDATQENNDAIWIVTTISVLCVLCITVCACSVRYWRKGYRQNCCSSTFQTVDTEKQASSLETQHESNLESDISCDKDKQCLIPKENDPELNASTTEKIPLLKPTEKMDKIDPQLQLHVACQEGMTCIVENLLKEGINMNFLNENGTSPLYMACQGGHAEVVRLLLENGADVHLGENSEYIPFFVACQQGHDAIVELMLNGGADIDTCKKDGASPLFIACQQSNESTVQLLLQNGADVNLCREGSICPLYIACQNGDERIVQFLLKSGADVNLCDKRKRSPLFEACCNGHYKTAKCLLDNGANINLCENSGGSPLFVACQERHNRCVQLLVSRGADVNLYKKDKASPLFVACQNGYISIVQILLSNNANVNSLTESKLSPLMAACKKGYDDIADILLKNGAEVNAPGVLFGYTPLCLACSNGRKSMVEILLRHNADINLRADDGSSPLSLAIESGNKLVNLLKQKGAIMEDE